MLTNTVYFNASWSTTFDKDATKLESFVKLDGTSVDVPTSLPVFVDDVRHEAVIQVVEGGTIGAAATEVEFASKDGSPLEHVVRFARPFLYAIVDQPTGQILFLGRVLDPSANWRALRAPQLVRPARRLGARGSP